METARADLDRCISAFKLLRTRSKPTTAPPRLSAFHKDLPEIEKPIEFISQFRSRRANWNARHPENLNGFPMPEMQSGTTKMKALLKKVASPAAGTTGASPNAEDAVRYIREIEELEAKGYPYRETLLKLHEASEVLALHRPKPGEPRGEKLNRAKFLKDNAADREDFARMMSDEIFIPTGHPQSVDGLAESTLLGTRALEVVENSGKIDGMLMNPRERFEHDVAHAMLPRADALSRNLLALPFETRVEILRSVDRLSDREAHLARFTIYRTVHEYGGESAIPKAATAENFQKIQSEYREAMNKDLTTEEAQWIHRWFRDVLVRELLKSPTP